MTWPTTPVATGNVDAGTDSPASARADLIDLIQKANQMIADVPVGRLLNVQVFAASDGTDFTGAYTPTPGTRVSVIKAVAGGGGSGGCYSAPAGYAAGSGAGASGNYAELAIVNPTSQSITVGGGGAPGWGGATGGRGGNTSMGSIFTLYGGYGGGAGVARNSFPYPGGDAAAQNPATSSTFSGCTVYQNIAGGTSDKRAIILTQGYVQESAHSPSPMGNGHPGGIPGEYVNTRYGYGWGASGVRTVSGESSSRGIGGAPGCMIIYEYS